MNGCFHLYVLQLFGKHFKGFAMGAVCGLQVGIACAAVDGDTDFFPVSKGQILDKVSAFYHIAFERGQGLHGLPECLDFCAALCSSIHIPALDGLSFLDSANEVFCKPVFYVCDLHNAYRTDFKNRI